MIVTFALAGELSAMVEAGAKGANWSYSAQRQLVWKHASQIIILSIAFKVVKAKRIDLRNLVSGEPRADDKSHSRNRLTRGAL